MNHFRRDSARAILEKAGLFPTDVDGHGVLVTVHYTIYAVNLQNPELA